MTGLTSDFLSTHSARIQELLRSQVDLVLSDDRGPRDFINAVLVALTADDLRPLTAYYELEPGKSAIFGQRLDNALSHLLELNKALDTAARDDNMDAAARLELALSAAEDLDGIRRRLVKITTHTLTDQLNSTRTASSARGSSLSITMHELRRPLTILNSYGQLLSSGMLGDLPESATVAIEGITSSTEMMVRLVNALSELSRLEDPDDALSIESMTLADVVSSAVDPMQTEARFREAVIDLDVQSDTSITGDRRRLTLALTNILSNALKHSPTEGVVKVRAFVDDDHAHFIVTDQGPGFPAEDGPHLFEKYFRSVAERHRQIPGSGLGLYIVKTIAQRHGGDVTARAEEGKGAEFEIFFPRTPGKS